MLSGKIFDKFDDSCRTRRLRSAKIMRTYQMIIWRAATESGKLSVARRRGLQWLTVAERQILAYTFQTSNNFQHSYLSYIVFKINLTKPNLGLLLQLCKRLHQKTYPKFMLNTLKRVQFSLENDRFDFKYAPFHSKSAEISPERLHFNEKINSIHNNALRVTKDNQVIRKRSTHTFQLSLKAFCAVQFVAIVI